MYVERGGPCRLLKLRQMGTFMKGVLPSLVSWFLRVSTRDFRPALAALVGKVQNNFFPHRTLFHFICPHSPASLEGSRAASPVF
jgi:hypothetical protein